MLEFAGCIRCGVIILAQFLQRVDAIPVTVIEIMKTTPPPFPSPYGAILGGVQVQVASHQHASLGILFIAMPLSNQVMSEVMHRVTSKDRLPSQCEVYHVPTLAGAHMNKLCLNVYTLTDWEGAISPVNKILGDESMWGYELFAAFLWRFLVARSK